MRRDNKSMKEFNQRRKVVIQEIVKLDKKYGEDLVRSAFSRKRERERLLTKLKREQAEIQSKINKLS